MRNSPSHAARSAKFGILPPKRLAHRLSGFSAYSAPLLSPELFYQSAAPSDRDSRVDRPALAEQDLPDERLAPKSRNSQTLRLAPESRDSPTLWLAREYQDSQAFRLAPRGRRISLKMRLAHGERDSQFPRLAPIARNSRGSAARSGGSGFFRRHGSLSVHGFLLHHGSYSAAREAKRKILAYSFSNPGNTPSAKRISVGCA